MNFYNIFDLLKDFLNIILIIKYQALKLIPFKGSIFLISPLNSFTIGN